MIALYPGRPFKRGDARTIECARRGGHRRAILYPDGAAIMAHAASFRTFERSEASRKREAAARARRAAIAAARAARRERIAQAKAHAKALACARKLQRDLDILARYYLGGQSIRGITRQLGLDRSTVQRVVNRALSIEQVRALKARWLAAQR